MSINLFEECLSLTVAGIKELKLCAKLEDGSPIDFPIDVVLKSGDTTTIIGSVDDAAQTVTIGGQTLQFVTPYIDNSSFTEEETEDRRGRYFNQSIEFQFPKVQLYTNNQLKDFLFTTNGQTAVANAVAIIKDNNDQQWVVGYTEPLVVQELELTTGGADNFYRIVLVARSYDRIRKFEYI